MKINNKYETQSFGYGQTLQTGERTWSCVVSPDPLHRDLLNNWKKLSKRWHCLEVLNENYRHQLRGSANLRG